LSLASFVVPCDLSLLEVVAVACYIPSFLRR
jgi:hypothetical protein